MSTDEITPTPAKRHRRKSGSYAAADERREQILQTAILHFAQWGYESSSVPKIAADVGLTNAGLLHHFGSKRELLTAVLELREKLAGEMFFKDLEAGRGDALILLSRIADLAEYNTTQPGLSHMYVVLAAEAVNPDHPAHQYFRDRYDRIIGFLAASMTDGIQEGILKPDLDVQEIAREVLATSDGLTLQWGLSSRSFDMAKSIRTYLDRLARQITMDHRGLPAS
ncbi:TetR/AcrR family transcriptional regulator [Arthrobacter sp. 2MCAF15]|uniref:TetR/AcrR family transcriptional regulator n=1 Tax=Arthrobacter sp. 2MCAF15 TaxID=3232984 RepID=UPI003F8D974F